MISYPNTVDSRYLKFDGIMEKIGVNRSSTPERKKTATKTSNMFKIVPRIGTCDAGFNS
jgi:hypothetical protein